MQHFTDMHLFLFIFEEHDFDLAEFYSTLVMIGDNKQSNLLAHSVHIDQMLHYIAHQHVVSTR